MGRASMDNQEKARRFKVDYSRMRRPQEWMTVFLERRHGVGWVMALRWFDGCIYFFEEFTI